MAYLHRMIERKEKEPKERFTQDGRTWKYHKTYKHYLELQPFFPYARSLGLKHRLKNEPSGRIHAYLEEKISPWTIYKDKEPKQTFDWTKWKD